MVTIVVVCYHSGPQLHVCLETLFNGKGDLSLRPDALAQMRVVLVNNSQDDTEEVQGIATEFGVDFVQSPQNVGYGSGCNLGAELSRDDDYTLFLNPDVRFPPETLARFIAIADAHPDIVAFGPLQSGPDGKVRGKRRAVGQRQDFGPPLRAAGEGSPLARTGFISGGALMVRSAVFHRIGGFDDRIFLFHEDDDLCLRLAVEGGLAYATDIVVTHDYGKSTPRTDDLTRFRSWHLGFSRVYVIGKHRGKLAALLSALHAVGRFLSPEILSARGRMKACAFLSGTRAALGGSAQGPASA